MTVQPIVAAERVVYYRERAASMYSPMPYALAQGVAELPYLAAQAVLMVCIAYWMVRAARPAGSFGACAAHAGRSCGRAHGPLDPLPFTFTFTFTFTCPHPRQPLCA
jgi:hypothetical protein